MKRLLVISFALAAVISVDTATPSSQSGFVPQVVAETPSMPFLPLGQGSRFLASTESAGVLVQPGGATIALATRPQRGQSYRDRAPKLKGIVRIKLVGARRVSGTGLERVPGTTTYARGRDSAAWLTEVTTFARVLYPGVYPGIDAEYAQRGGRLHLRFRVAPHARVGRVRLTLSKTRLLALRARCYQTAGNRRLPVPCRIVRRSRTLRFSVAGYDRQKELLLDAGATLPRSATKASSAATDVAVDAEGSSYVAGAKWVILPPDGGGGGRRVFVATLTKITPDGARAFTTHLAGAGALAVALGSNGSAYLTGVAYADDFPVTKNAFQGYPGASEIADAFVTKIGRTGAIAYSTRLGGANYDHGYGIDVDEEGNAYVTGGTRSGPRGPFPTTPGALRKMLEYEDYWDAFVTKLDPTGSSLEFSTYLGGTYYDTGFGIAATPDGGAVVTGHGGFAECWPACPPDARPFPTTPGAYQEQVRGFHDAFVSRLDSRGSRLVYSTLLGGDGKEFAYDLALAPDGTAWIVGFTFPGYGPPFTNNFPTTPTAFQPTWRHTHAIGGGFVSAVAAEGTTLAYSSLITGAAGGESAESISLDASGNVYVVGETSSRDFPTTPDALQRTHGGGSDGFILSPELDRPGLRYSSYLGENTNEVLAGVAVGAGRMTVVGNGSSKGWPYFKSPAFWDPFTDQTGNGFLKSFQISR